MKEKKVYYDDRTQKQREENLVLDEKKFIKTNKKILLIGLDGTEIKNVMPIIIKNKLKFNVYQIQNFESVKGWTAILYGNILKQGKNIFQILNENNLKTAFLCNSWDGFEKEILSNTSVITKYKKFENENHDTYIKSTFDKGFAGVEEKIQDGCNECIAALKSQQFDFIFYYDVFADEAGHYGFDYNSEMTRNVFDTYEKKMSDLIQLAIQNGYDVLITTDHGRNPNQIHHHEEYLQNRLSWLASTFEVSNFPENNINDIKKITINYLLK